MFDRRSYCSACDRLCLDADKIEEMIEMTENTSKKAVHRPVRVMLVAAALTAALGITASAASIPAVQEFFATIFVTVTSDDAGLNLPNVAVEEREGRSILIIDGEKTDITDALEKEGGYRCEGDGFEVAVDENGVAMVTAFGEDGMTVSYSTAYEDVQGGTVYKVATGGGEQDLQNYNIITDVEGVDALTEGEGLSSYEVTSDGEGVISVKSVGEK